MSWEIYLEHKQFNDKNLCKGTMQFCCVYSAYLMTK